MVIYLQVVPQKKKKRKSQKALKAGAPNGALYHLAWPCSAD